jgi:hypothetical protein
MPDWWWAAAILLALCLCAFGWLWDWQLGAHGVNALIDDVESFVATHAWDWLQLPNTDVGELTRLGSFPDGLVTQGIADCSHACDAETTCTCWVATSDPKQLVEGANCWLGSGWAVLRTGVVGRVFEDRTSAGMEAEAARLFQGAVRLRAEACEARDQAAAEKARGKEAAKRESDSGLARAGLARAAALLQKASDLDNRAWHADEDGRRASELASRVAAALVAARQLEGRVMTTRAALLETRDWYIDHERFDEADSVQAEGERLSEEAKRLAGFPLTRRAAFEDYICT